MSWESYERSAERGPFGFGAKIILLLVGLSCVAGVATFVLNPFSQAGRIINKTIDADNVLYNYEWFKRQYRDVDAIDKKIAGQRVAIRAFEDSAGPRTDWKREDREEHARLSSIATGLEQQRADMVSLYNARASMANRSIFMGGDCPLELQ